MKSLSRSAPLVLTFMLPITLLAGMAWFTPQAVRSSEWEKPANNGRRADWCRSTSPTRAQAGRHVASNAAPRSNSTVSQA